MSTTIYHNHLSPEAQSALTDVYYMGNMMAVALNRNDANQHQRDRLYNDWFKALDNLKAVIKPELEKRPATDEVPAKLPKLKIC